MRETKYRVWHRQERRMYVVNHIRFDIDGIARIATGSISSDTWNVKDLELMEFTGVRTYHKIEIYEGDIIEFQLCESGKRYIKEVTFIEGCFMADMTTRLSTAMYVEIIGNVWEHPELLVEAG